MAVGRLLGHVDPRHTLKFFSNSKKQYTRQEIHDVVNELARKQRKKLLFFIFNLHKKMQR